MARPHSVQSILIDGKPVDVVVNGAWLHRSADACRCHRWGFLSILSPEMDWWSGLNMTMASSGTLDRLLELSGQPKTTPMSTARELGFFP